MGLLGNKATHNKATHSYNVQSYDRQVFINVSGFKDGQLVQESYANKIYSKQINGKLWSAIQITTASGICTVLDLMAGGKLAQQGFVKQEDVLYQDFITNRFGQYYQRDIEKLVAE